MPVYPVIRHGEPVTAPDGTPRYTVHVYDRYLGTKVVRRVAGEAAARALEADLKRQASVPLEARPMTTQVVAAAVKRGTSLTIAPDAISVARALSLYLQAYKTRRDGSPRPRLDRRGFRGRLVLVGGVSVAATGCAGR